MSGISRRVLTGIWLVAAALLGAVAQPETTGAGFPPTRQLLAWAMDEGSGDIFVPDDRYQVLAWVASEAGADVHSSAYPVEYRAMTSGGHFNGQPAWGPVWWRPDPHESLEQARWHFVRSGIAQPRLGAHTGRSVWYNTPLNSPPPKEASMPNPTAAPYGSWKSPITADLIATSTVALSEPLLDGEDLYWAELRPAESGRVTIARRTADGNIEDLIPVPFNARTRVHEYGGGAYSVHEGSLYFSNFADQRVYRIDPGQAPRPITPEAAMRFADFTIDRWGGRLICAREDHTDGGREAVNTIVALGLAGGDSGQVLVSGGDFYSTPRVSPDGNQLAWLTWNHPNMPWDGCELWVAELRPDGSLGSAELVAGGKDESIFQPEWSPDGALYFVSDRTGWWNLYRRRKREIEAMTAMEGAEFGQPQWVFGLSTYAFQSARRIVCTYHEEDAWRLATIDTVTLNMTPVDSPYTEIAYVDASGPRVALIAGSPTSATSVVRYDDADGRFETVRRSSGAEFDPAYLSAAQLVRFPTENGLTSYGYFYAPRNPSWVGLPGERPPLLVMSHGGPTAASGSSLNPRIQFWTSRGIAVLDVNYGGSTGYGRAYRERLKGQWGLVDVDDCVNGARFLALRGDIDGARLAIRGGSAGGYTTLAALTFRDAFSTGASYYGVSDLEVLVRDTHKFESRYLDGLIGPYPEARQVYLDRSPIHFVERLSRPMILFQGLEDKIVPPNQAELMFNAVRAKGLPVAYLAFEGEQHGFRKAENIKRSMEAELYFYGKIFGFQPADVIEPVHIENE